MQGSQQDWHVLTTIYFHWPCKWSETGIVALHTKWLHSALFPQIRDLMTALELSRQNPGKGNTVVPLMGT